MNNIWTKKNNKLIMKSTTKNHVSNSLNLRALVRIGEKCRTYLLVIFAFLLTALPGWALSVVQESVTIANTDGTGLNYKLYGDNTAALLGATSEEISALNIPASVTYGEQEYKVTKIGDDAFGYPYLQSISGGENITEIGDNAFHGCSALTGSIEFNKVTNIGEGAFGGCGNGGLNLTFNNLECKTIGPSAFNNFKGTVNLYGNVNYIAGNAFCNENNNNNANNNSTIIYTPPQWENVAYLHNPTPEYPEISQQRGEQGTVKIKAVISESGSVINAEIWQSSKFSRLDSKALETIKKWKFIPARSNQKNVQTEVIIPIRFILNNV